MRKFLVITLCICFCLIFSFMLINAEVKSYGITLSPEEAAQVQDADCILVLGCGVWDSGPSPMLADRILTGVELYRAGAAPKLLMSGDHGRKDYDEVNTMKSCAIQQGVPSADIFMDHAGFSTYESIYRAASVFGVKKMIIVTQSFHLPRALYLADQFGIQAVGVAADKRPYGGAALRNIRESLARSKDVLSSVLRPAPTYLGDRIPITGSGDVTNDR